MGSILGSLLLGARSSSARLPPAGRAMPAAWPCSPWPAFYAPLLAVAAPLAGFCLGPALPALFGQAARVAPPWLRHRDPGLAQLDHERWRGRRRGAGLALASAGATRPLMALALALVLALAGSGRGRPRSAKNPGGRGR